MVPAIRNSLGSNLLLEMRNFNLWFHLAAWLLHASNGVTDVTGTKKCD